MIYDITFCANRQCPKAKECGRSVVQLDKEPLHRWISLAGFSLDESGNCEHFMPMPKEEKEEDRGEEELS